MIDIDLRFTHKQLSSHASITPLFYHHVMNSTGTHWQNVDYSQLITFMGALQL